MPDEIKSDINTASGNGGTPVPAEPSLNSSAPAPVKSETQKKKFNLGEAISKGWEIVTKNLWFFIGLSIISMLVSYLPNIIEKYTGNGIGSFLITVLFWILNAYISIGVIRISLKFIDNNKASYNDLFSNGKLLLNFILGSFLYGLIVFAGFILLIVPGIVWSIKYQFYAYYILDEGLGPVEALGKSSELTMGAKWDLFILDIVFFFIIILGAIVLGVGLLVAIPITWIATAFVFRQLQGKINSSEEKVVKEETPIAAN